MSLILAIEPDLRQSLTLTTLSRARLNAELVLGDTATRALEALGSRRPDLVLISPRLSERDEATLTARLKACDGGVPVPRMVIPPLNPPPGEKKNGKTGRPKPFRGTTHCDPLAFSEQVVDCLETAAAERAALAAAQAELEAAWATDVTGSPHIATTDVTTLQSATDAPAPGVPENEASPAAGESAPLVDGPPLSALPDGPLLVDAVSATANEQVAPTLDWLEGATAAAELPPASEERLVAPTLELVQDEPVEEWEELALEAAVTPREATAETATEPFESAPAAAAIELGNEIDEFVRQLEAVPTGAPSAAAVTPAMEAQPPAVASIGLEGIGSDDSISVAAVAALSTPIEELTVAAEEPTRGPLPALVMIEETAQPSLAPVALRSETDHQQVDLLPMVAASDPEPAPPSLSGELGPSADQTAKVVELRPLPVRPASGLQDVLSAIRRDIKQLRGDEQPADDPRRVAASTPGVEMTSVASHPTAPEVTSSRTPQTDPRAAAPEVRRDPMPWRPRVKSRPAAVAPVQDEWGFFDPQQCGFEALRAKLEEMMNEHAARKRSA